MGRIITEEQREKRRKQARKRWDAMTPEQREAYRKRERERIRTITPERRAARNERARARRKAWTREQKDEHNRKQRARYQKRINLCEITQKKTESGKPVENKPANGLWQSTVSSRRKRRARNQQKRFVFPELLPYGEPCGIVYMVNKQAQKAPKFIYPEDYVGICKTPEQYQDIEPVKVSRVHEFDWDAPDLDA